jgi:hypothetical protein
LLILLAKLHLLRGGGKRNNKPGKNERLKKKLKAMGEVSATSSFCSPMHPNQ